MTTPRVLSVGQCGMDHGRIARYLRNTFGAGVDDADTAAEALDALRAGGVGLVLVNRILDADGSPGLDLIRAIKSDPALAGTPTMLVSNYPEAQREAAALGALPGFGKADVGREEARAALEAALNPAESQ